MPGYFAKKSDEIVHHLGALKKECSIYPVQKEDKVYFMPDSLENALSQKFTPCKYCIG